MQPFRLVGERVGEKEDLHCLIQTNSKVFLKRFSMKKAKLDAVDSGQHSESWGRQRQEDQKFKASLHHVNPVSTTQI